MQGTDAQLTVQRPLRMLTEQPRPRKVEDALLGTCGCLLDAIHLCIHLSKLPHYVIAEKLGVDRGHWTRMMQSQAHFPTNKMQMLMEVCGNYAPAQFLAKSCGFEMFEDAKAKRKEELRRELEQLEAA
jgi:hypothetical protein